MKQFKGITAMILIGATMLSGTGCLGSGAGARTTYEPSMSSESKTSSESSESSETVASSESGTSSESSESSEAESSSETSESSETSSSSEPEKSSKSKSGAKDISSEDFFFDALKEGAGFSKNETKVNDKDSTYDGIPVEYVTYGEYFHNSYCYIRYKSADDALKEFKDVYDSFEEVLGNKDYTGTNKRAMSKDQGYLIMSGKVKKGVAFAGLTFYMDDTEYYGVYYVNKNVYIEVFSLNGDESEKAKVDAVLKKLNLPTP